MIGWGQVTGKGMLLKGLPNFWATVATKLITLSAAYPWASLPEGTTVCDLGGGNGHVTLDLIRSFPQLRIVLQDLQSVVDEGRKVRSSHGYNALIGLTSTDLR